MDAKKQCSLEQVVRVSSPDESEILREAVDSFTSVADEEAASPC